MAPAQRCLLAPGSCPPDTGDLCAKRSPSPTHCPPPPGSLHFFYLPPPASVLLVVGAGSWVWLWDHGPAGFLHLTGSVALRPTKPSPRSDDRVRSPFSLLSDRTPHPPSGCQGPGLSDHSPHGRHLQISPHSDTRDTPSQGAVRRAAHLANNLQFGLYLQGPLPCPSWSPACRRGSKRPRKAAV